MKKNGEHFVTCGQMKVLERRADESGHSYYRMMENAGSCAASTIMERAAYWFAAEEESGLGGYGNAAGMKAAEDIYKIDGNDTAMSAKAKTIAADKLNKALAKVASDRRKTVYIFCGKGNNGGDGFVVARLLHDKGFNVTVILVDGEPVTQDAITNLGLVRVRDIRVLDMAANNRALLELKNTPGIIVDAIYGTGFKGELKSNGLKAAIYINSYSKGERGERSQANVMVAALDIPSGISGDLVNRKLIDKNCITAHFTVTFHAKKPVHVQKFAKEYCGDIIVADIGIDEEKLWNVEVEY